jgi:hypothetical protein
MTNVSAGEFSARARKAGIKDDFVIYVEMAGGYEPAAVLLRRCVIWSGGGTVGKGGWFYKSASEWQKETRCTRTKIITARKRLREAGVLKESLRRVQLDPALGGYVQGKTVLHYRLDPVVFWKRFEEAIRVIKGVAESVDVREDRPESEKIDPPAPVFVNTNKPANAIDENLQGQLQETNDRPCGIDGNASAENLQLNHAVENSTLESISSEGSVQIFERETEYLDNLQKKMPGFKAIRSKLEEQLKRIGFEAFKNVVTRCEIYKPSDARYLLVAVSRETVPLPPSSERPPSQVFDRVEREDLIAMLKHPSPEREIVVDHARAKWNQILGLIPGVIHRRGYYALRKPELYLDGNKLRVKLDTRALRLNANEINDWCFAGRVVGVELMVEDVNDVGV